VTMLSTSIHLRDWNITPTYICRMRCDFFALVHMHILCTFWMLHDGNIARFGAFKVESA
jgi:hypothetical protein